MPRISMKKIALAFVVLFLLSRSAKIAAYLSDLEWDSWFTLEPLRNSPPLARYTATLAVLALFYVTIVMILIKRKERK